MLWWEEGFCRSLAGYGRFVIRYDHRDTGRSTTYEPGRPGYTGGDLLADAVGVLDAYRLDVANLVGVSAGGALVQLIALDFPSRVRSLVLISTSPATPGDRNLPPPTAAFGQFVRSATVDWSDADSVIDYLVAYARVLAGEERRFEEAEVRDLVRRDVERARDFAALQNHDLLEDKDKPRRPSVVNTGADARHPRHGRSHVPARSRPGARERDPERSAASARRGGPRRRARRLGRHHGGNRSTHCRGLTYRRYGASPSRGSCFTPEDACRPHSAWLIGTGSFVGPHPRLPTAAKRSPISRPRNHSPARHHPILQALSCTRSTARHVPHALRRRLSSLPTT